MRRKHIPLKTKLAAALLHMRRATPDGRWVLIIPFSEAQRMTPDAIISRFRFDHHIPHAEGGPDEAWNLDPLPVAEHLEKTTKIDVPGIAKRKRVARKHAEHQQRMQTPRDERPAKKTRWASRPFNRRTK